MSERELCWGNSVLEHGEIESIPTAVLKPRPDNPRTHSSAQIAKIVASIKKFGFTSPILIDENNMVLAGHGRLAAAHLLWLSKVPCRRLVNMSDKEKRAYVLADNKLAADAGWDQDLLVENFAALGEIDFDITITGFDAVEIEEALSRRDAESTHRPRAGEDEAPAVDKSHIVSQLGDIWVLGRHRLACGDACDLDVLNRLMGSERADMIFADPPYNVRINGHVSGLGKVQHAEFEMASGEMSSTEFSGFLEATLGNGVRQCRDGAIAFICMDWRHIGDLLNAGKMVFSEFKNLCVWNKTNAGMGAFYRSKHELIGVFKVGTAPHTNTFGLGDKGRYRTNVWSYPGVNAFGADRTDDLSRHPTSKPVAMVADAIRDVSNRSEIVLDMVGGSGTTLIAAQSSGRLARVVEISPAYCDVIVRRWQKFTGKFATLDRSGMSFENVQANQASGEAK